MSLSCFLFLVACVPISFSFCPLLSLSYFYLLGTRTVDTVLALMSITAMQIMIQTRREVQSATAASKREPWLETGSDGRDEETHGGI